MGFDLFTHSFKDGHSTSYNRRIAEEIFNRDAIDPKTPLTEVRYADGRAEIYGAESEDMDGVMVAHFSGRTIYERILELAATTNSLIFWPAESDCWMAVTSEAMLQHLPKDITEKGEKVAIVRNVEELIEVIW